MGEGCLHVQKSELHLYLCCLLVSVSIVYPLISWNMASKEVKKKEKKKNAGGPSDATPLFPPWTLGPGVAFASQGAKRREQHMESIGAAGRDGMENDKNGCPSSFPLNTGPKSILLPA